MQLQGRDRVKVVCMDLCETYRQLVKNYFPNAAIVADRFHVIRLVNHAFMRTWQAIDPSLKSNRGYLSLMRTHQWNLTPQRLSNLQAYLKKKPAIQALYQAKQELTRILTQKGSGRKQWLKLANRFISWIEKLQSSGFPFLETLGKTLESWQEEIARMWRYSKSNSITEGFHRKMKLIQRRAYGFKNFENYRLRVKVLCG